MFTVINPANPTAVFTACLKNDVTHFRVNKKYSLHAYWGLPIDR